MENVSKTYSNVNKDFANENATRNKSATVRNVSVKAKIQNNVMHVKKDCFESYYSSCGIVEYLASTIDNSVIMCDEILTVE